MTAEKQGNQPEISALITCYYEEKTIDEFYGKLSAALEQTGRSYEIVFVNDGSTDGTFGKLKAIFEKDPHVHCVMDFFKNAGQPAAVTAAICASRGRIVLSMDSDLQLDPADLHRLLEKFDQGCDVVSGYREHRQDSLLRQWPSVLANIIMRRASKTTIRDFGCTFKLYHGRLLRGFNLGPLNVFNPATVISKCQRWAEVPVSHAARKHGKSGWTFRKLWDYQMEQMVVLTEKPFQYMGAGAFILALLFLLRVLVEVVTPFRVMNEVTNGLILTILLIVFLVLFGCLCLVGEFAIRGFLASRHVPKYIIRETLERD